MSTDPNTPDQPPVVRIQHVALELPEAELDRARELWRLCGFDEVEVPASLKGRSIWMEAGPPAARTQVHLLVSGRDGAPEPKFGGHVAVVATHFEGQIEDLKAAGFQVEPRTAHWGAARAFVDHPGGHTVELMAFPPA